MKKMMIIAVFTAMAFAMVSCDKESIENISPKENKKIEASANAYQTERDSIVAQDAPIDEPGPGDEVVPVKPPKP